MAFNALLTPELWLLLAPLIMLVVGVVPSTLANRLPQQMALAVQMGTALGLVLWLVAIVVSLSGETAEGFLRWAVQADRVTFAILPLVAFLLSIVAGYSSRYLAGEAEQGRFFRWLALTAGGFMMAVVAGNLLLFVLAMLITGSFLNKLLTYYQERIRAQMVAHKKLLFSRVADFSLVAAAVLLGFGLGTLSFDGIAAEVSSEAALPWQAHIAAWLIVAYTVLKSGQFPFHGWLLQVMEAPTPVSALLHAGIVYSGAIVVLRTHELLMAEGGALTLMLLVGLVTAAIASLAMLTQTAIKSSLAWSTAGQLGFMLMELGLGLFVLGLLHLIAHSLYKAHAFLSSGSIVDLLRGPAAPPKRSPPPAMWLVTVLGSAVITFGMAALWGLTPANEPALIALGAILSVAINQLLLASRTSASSAGFLGKLVGLSVVVSAAYFALHKLFAAVFAADLKPIPETASAGQYLLLGLVAVIFLSLSFFQTVLIHRGETPWLKRLYVHLYNGLYTDQPVERLVYRVWPAKFRR
ncbi:proton-conducting transporter transmembrane domain-containing protein [Thiohalorhabdus sp.]|uniref:proton-conducting transporter transmembrane domain-containing protein n=1 Tax=Thiohalorhabdus sp. TaxID=3094134 RepID=UPI002FC2BA84